MDIHKLELRIAFILISAAHMIGEREEIGRKTAPRDSSLGNEQPEEICTEEQ